MNPRRPTIKDIALHAGVGQATVSYVLTGKGSISVQTRERVKKAASDLNYVPNLAARAMRRKQTNRLAIVTGIHDYDAAPVVAGATEEAAKAGFFVESYSLNQDFSGQDQRIVELAQSGQIAGLLCFAQLTDSALREIESIAPVIKPDTFSAELFNVGELADGAPVVEFVERLAASGFTRFMHIGGPVDSVSAGARRRAYSATIQRLGLESVGMVDGDWSAACGLAAIESLPNNTPPIAIIAGNDRVAVGVMRGAHLRGWRIPVDVAVTGWNNYEISAFLNPPLTTVNVDRFEAGRWEMRRLIAAIKNDDEPSLPPVLNKIIWRESTGA